MKLRGAGGLCWYEGMACARVSGTARVSKSELDCHRYRHHHHRRRRRYPVEAGSASHTASSPSSDAPALAVGSWIWTWMGSRNSAWRLGGAGDCAMNGRSCRSVSGFASETGTQLGSCFCCRSRTELCLVLAGSSLMNGPYPRPSGEGFGTGTGIGKNRRIRCMKNNWIPIPSLSDRPPGAREVLALACWLDILSYPPSGRPCRCW